jgi:hypothetical protein
MDQLLRPEFLIFRQLSEEYNFFTSWSIFSYHPNPADSEKHSTSDGVQATVWMMNALALSVNLVWQTVAVAEQCTCSLNLLLLNLSWKFMLMPKGLKSFF